MVVERFTCLIADFIVDISFITNKGPRDKLLARYIYICVCVCVYDNNWMYHISKYRGFWKSAYSCSWTIICILLLCVDILMISVELDCYPLMQISAAIIECGGNMVDHCCCRVGSRIIQHTRTPVSELLAPSLHHLRWHDVRTIHLH
jgi:hypothetical protein